MIPVRPEATAAMESMDQQAVMSTVAVVAPCDLHAGYVFVAKVNGQKIRVTVPDGGVKQGQVFDIAVVPSIKGDGGAPSPRSIECDCGRSSAARDNTTRTTCTQQHQGAAAGEWKDGVCDLFRFGVLHPTVWNALCCPQVLMKQLSNRLSGADGTSNDELPACGGKGEKSAASSEHSNSGSANGEATSVAGYKRGTTLFLVACVVDFLLIAPILEATASVAHPDGGGQHSSHEASSAAVSLGTQCFYVLWTLALTAIAIYSVVQLRAAVRAKYGIAPGRCGACEDVCCVVCCHSCTLAQLARQTADYDEEEAHCCTVDGLSGSKRLNPCLFL